MITDTTKKVLITIAIISLITIVFGNLLPNFIFNFGEQSIILNSNLLWEDRLFLHYRHGVCGIGLITGILLVFLLIVQISLLNNLDNKDLQSRKNLAVATLVIILLYFFYTISFKFIFKSYH